MLLKSGNGSVWASGSISAPTLGIASTSAHRHPFGGQHFLVPDAMYDPPVDFDERQLRGDRTDRIGDSQEGGSTEVCLDTTTTYKITAIGESGLSATAQVTVNVATMPFPVIEISRQTIEKKDADGNITGNITFYFENGLPACSCTTGPGDLILDFPCDANPLPTNCSNAFTGSSPGLHPVSRKIRSGSAGNLQQWFNELRRRPRDLRGSAQRLFCTMRHAGISDPRYHHRGRAALLHLHHVQGPIVERNVQDGNELLRHPLPVI